MLRQRAFGLFGEVAVAHRTNIVRDEGRQLGKHSRKITRVHGDPADLAVDRREILASDGEFSGGSAARFVSQAARAAWSTARCLRTRRRANAAHCKASGSDCGRTASGASLVICSRSAEKAPSNCRRQSCRACRCSPSCRCSA
jgi:hypothetical protein